jgi:hypothetical protein
MEKLMYPLWKSEGVDPDDFRKLLVGDIAPEIAALAPVLGARVAAVDSDVDAAAGRRMISHPPGPDAVLSLWVDHAGAAPAWRPLLDLAAERWSGYLVVEAEPLVSAETHAVPPGQRGFGMCQVVFLQQPPRLSRDQWLAIWKDSHTQVAMDTQSTFGYRQNLVARLLTDSTPPCDAIVEENFPPEAMASDHAFYDSGGDEARLQAHMRAMMESCARFIDFDQLDVLPMSEYLIRSPIAR